jgi:hypothetical protein
VSKEEEQRRVGARKDGHQNKRSMCKMDVKEAMAQSGDTSRRSGG